MKARVLWGAVLLAAIFAVWRLDGASAPAQTTISTPLSREFVDHAFAGIASASDPAVRGVVVNHHLLAPRLIARGVSAIATTDTVLVVVITPDHFGAGAAPITIGDITYATPFGELRSDSARVRAIASASLAFLQDAPFQNEHGLFSVAPFIRKALPNARVIPILVKDGVPAEMVGRLAQYLGVIPGALFIGSFDFSHDTTAMRAERNDATTIQAFMSGSDVSSAAVDSRAGLSLFVQSMAAAGVSRFTLMENTNSARILGQPERTDVTSYILGTWSAGRYTK